MQIRLEKYQIATPPMLMESFAKNEQNVQNFTLKYLREYRVFFKTKGIFLKLISRTIIAVNIKRIGGL